MRLLFTFLLLGFFSQLARAQCPPPGFPDAGNTCVLAPILCANLNGYCNTINNNNVVQNFPGCPGFQLNNDEWFAFYAGSTTISIKVTPSNCTSNGNNQGLQAGIYKQCTSMPMALQCSCQTNPFTLTATNYVIGQVYYMVIDGCGGDVCDYAIQVTAGSTVGAPPANPGPITGPANVCEGSTTTYSITPPVGATIYTWTLAPNIGTITGNSNSINIAWGTNTTSAQLCVSTSNACYSNPTQSCYDIDVIPKPTATISGSGNLCAAGSGSVNLNVAFTGEGPWTFIYRINGTNQPAITTSSNPYTIVATTPGTYTLASVTGGAATCTGTVSGTSVITQTNITATTTVTNASCGQSNGAISLTASGGAAPYTYLWSGGQTTKDLATIPSGTYTVTVTDNNGCTKTATATVNNNTITINLSAALTTNTTCINGNGAINLTATPANPYTYLWSGGETTEDLSNLPPGTYTVTVTYGVSCTNTASYTINDNPNTPNITSTITQSTCDQTNGSINVTVSGGVTPYTYLWSNGTTTEDLSGVLAGSYQLTVTGANGCTKTTDLTITNNNPNINVNATVVNNTTCLNGNGSINVTVTPANTYTYNWSNGATTEDLSNLPPGTYSITVTQVGTCTQTADFTINDNPILPNINQNIVASTCDLANGAITLTVNGGVSPYTYLWSNGATTSGLTLLLAGSYQVTVTGANGCTQTADLNLGNNNPPINITATTTANTICNPSAGNGSINVSVSPANPAYTYIWSNGATTQDLSNLPTGTYSITVSAGGTCTNSADFDVSDNPNLPIITGVTTESTCDLANGSINISVSGATVPYTYAWSNGATTQDQTGLVANGYTVTVTGANGCTSTADYSITNNNPPITVTAVVSSNTTCNASSNGAINVTVVPAGTYTYTWSNGATTQDLTGLPAGTYAITVSGAGSCSETASFDVNDNPNVPNLNFSDTNARCGLNNGAINLSVSGGVTPYTYLWTNNATTQDLNNIGSAYYEVTVTGGNGCTSVGDIFVDDDAIPITVDGILTDISSCLTNNGKIVLQYSPLNASISWSNGSTATTLNNLAPGDYTVTVSAGGTCTETNTFTLIDATEIPTLTTDVSPALCGLSNGGVDLEVTGGLSPYNYKWSNGANTQDLINKAAGTFTVTVTSAGGCSATTTVTIPSTNLTIAIFGGISDNTSCGQPNGSIFVTVDPIQNYKYKWSTGAVVSDLYNLAPGMYTVTVSFGNTCTSSSTFEVLNIATAPNLSASAVAATCNLNNGSLLASASGGEAPYTYKWSNAAVTAQVNNVLPGTYTVTVTGNNACTATATAVVSNNNIALNISGLMAENTSCTNANGALDITIAPVGAYSYAWSNSAITQDIGNLAQGPYTVTVTAGVSCSATAKFTVDNNTPNPNIAPNVTAAICSQSNGAIDLTISNATGPYSFIWSNSATTEDLNGVPPGNYAVTVTASNGCKADTFLNVANNSTGFSLSGTAKPLTHCTVPNGAINFTVSPPGAYLINWSNGATTEDISQLTAGIYTVSVTEVGSCIASATYVVADQRVYPTSTQTLASEICGLLNGSLDLSPQDGTPPYAFNWSSGQISEDLLAVAANTYTVTITDANTCTATATGTIPGNTVSFALAGNAQPNTSCVSNNGGIDLNVSPATPSFGLNYTYSWSNSLLTQDLNAVAGGAYMVTVSAGGTCTNVASFNIPDTSNPPQLSAGVTPAFCGQKVGGIDLSASGSQAPFTYKWSNSSPSEDLSAIASGDYTVTVVGADGCKTIQDFTVPENTILPSISGATTPLTSCISNNGSISITVSPAGTYAYQWSNTSNQQDLSNLPTGSYTVTVNGGGACISTATYTVDNATQAVTLSNTNTNILCFGDITGAIDVSVIGGTGPYTYKWQPSVPGNVQDLSNLTPGTYKLTVTDANGCSAAASYAITQPAAALQINCSATNTVSFPGGSDGSGAINIAGGTAPYTVTPSVGSPQTGVNAGTLNFTNLPVGNYQVAITDANGCTADCGFQVKLIDCKTAVGSMATSAISKCGNTCITATYNSSGQFLDANDLLQFVLHEGTGNTIVNERARNTQPVFCFDPAKMSYGTTYYISAAVGDNDGTGNVNLTHWCTEISTGTPIQFIETPVASINPPDPLNCVVKSVPLFCNTSIATVSYQWDTGTGLILGPSNQATTTAGKAGTYRAIISANGCSDTASVVVKNFTNNPIATISANPSDILDCTIQEIVLAGTIEGSLNANAIWFSGGQIFANGSIVPISQPGDYQFIIVDTLTLCRDTALIKIDENLAFPPLFLNPTGKLDCINKTVVLSGGSSFPGIQFRWAQISGTDTTYVGAGNNLAVTTPGTYYLIGIDPVNSCTNGINTTVQADVDTPVADAGLPFTIPCFGDTASLDGSASTGAPNMSFAWSTTNGTLVQGSKTAKPIISTPGTYLLVVTNPDNGCTDSEDVVIDPEAPVAVLDVKQPPCFGDKGAIIVKSVSGGKPPVKYSLDNGQKFTTSNQFLNLLPGIYNLLVVDAVGCSTSAQTEIIAAKPFEITLDPQVKIKLGDTILINTQISALPGDIKTVKWLPSTALECDTCLVTNAYPVSSTRYKLKVTSVAGCSDEALIQILVDKRFDIYVPNIFSPDGDGKNDVFMIFADQKMVKNIKSFQIYARWGERVFEFANFLPNNQAMGWNGKHDGKDLTPGVFAWYAVIELVDGEEVLLEGDVTLKR
jgi:gliding motility-associated-like protein